MENKQNTCKVSYSMKTSVQPVWKLSNVSAIYRIKNRLFSLTNLFISLKAWEKNSLDISSFFFWNFSAAILSFLKVFEKYMEGYMKKCI